MSDSIQRFDAAIDRRGTNTYKWDRRPANAAGDPLLPMWVADMDFAAPPAVVDAIRRRAEHPVFGYTFASPDYHEAFRAWQSRCNGWEIDPPWLLGTPGVMPVVRAAILAFSEPGDEVVIQPPVYFPFFDAIRQNGRVVLENPLVEEPAPADATPYHGVRYSIDFHGLEASISPRTKILLFCSPHNPVGRVWTRDELERLAEIARRHDLVVIADEIHSDLIRAGGAFVPFVTLGDDAASRSIACHAPSKTFNIAGIASSHTIVADAELRSRLESTLHRLGMTLPNLLAIEAAHAAYVHAEPWTVELLSYLDRQIVWFAEQVAQRFPTSIRLSPIEGTYLAWLDFRPLAERTGASHTAIERALVEHAAIWLSEGKQFGTQGEFFFRLNLATPRRYVEDGLERIARAIEYLERDS